MSIHAVADGALQPAVRSLPHRAVLDGIDSLSDAEVLSLVVGTSRRAPIGSIEGVIEENGGLAGLARCGIRELSRARGVGPARALRLAAALELGRRVVQVAALEAMPRLPDQRSVVAWAKPRLATLDHEELWTLVLDGRHGLRAARRVASGGVHGLHVGVRDVLRVVLREAGGAFILVHNHPSGDPQPSEEDVAFTKAVLDGASAIGTPFLDHIVIARQRSSSMLELGLLAPAGRR